MTAGIKAAEQKSFLTTAYRDPQALRHYLTECIQLPGSALHLDGVVAYQEPQKI